MFRVAYDTVGQELFLVAVDKETGKIAGFLNEIATDESCFGDGFFTDATLHNPKGKNIMLLGLDVLWNIVDKGLKENLSIITCKEKR